MRYLDRIHHGDCSELLGDLPSESVDLIVSSPPYNLGKEYEARRALDQYLDHQTRVLEECVRVLRPTGSIYWQVGAFSDSGTLIPLDIRFFPILESLGLQPRNRIVWVRQHGLHARRKFSCRHETILWFTKTEDYYFDLDSIRVPQKYQSKKAWTGKRKGQLTCNPDGKNPGDIWAFRNVKHNHEERTKHPCQFPEDLVARIVLSSCPPGGTILDPYLGAGTVAVVAKSSGRHFVGAETDPAYCEIAERRLSGAPDEDGSFANLKNLRDHVERTGEPIERLRYDVQVSDVATPRKNARILPESHHLIEQERRLVYEAEAFAARRSSEEAS
jgi:adenine-specific DNA-methyltransferase